MESALCSHSFLIATCTISPPTHQVIWLISSQTHSFQHSIYMYKYFYSCTQKHKCFSYQIRDCLGKEVATMECLHTLGYHSYQLVKNHYFTQYTQPTHSTHPLILHTDMQEWRHKVCGKLITPDILWSRQQWWLQSPHSTPVSGLSHWLPAVSHSDVLIFGSYLVL